jgi:hypothetical protein
MLKYSEASYGRQIIVGLIDASLSIIFVILFIIKMPEFVNTYFKDVNGSLLVAVVFVLYRLFSLLLFHQTVGMRLFRVVLLNGEEQPLTFLEKSLAAVFILFCGTAYYRLK